MGKSSSKTLNQIDPTQSAELFDQSGNCKFYRNKAGKEFQKYLIEGEISSDFQNKYDFRIKNPSPYLVNALYAKPTHNAFGCSSSETFQVVTERIYKRMADINILTTQQALNTTYRALKGYQQIFRSSGMLLVTQSMIGLDRDNKIKVWLNTNFGLNHKESQPLSYSILPKIQQQNTLVDNIVQLISHKTSKSKEWIDFLQDKYSRGKIGFKEAMQVVLKHGQRNQVVVDGSFGEREDAEYWEAGHPKSKITLHHNIQEDQNSFPNQPTGDASHNHQATKLQSSEVAKTYFTRERFPDRSANGPMHNRGISPQPIYQDVSYPRTRQVFHSNNQNMYPVNNIHHTHNVQQQNNYLNQNSSREQKVIVQNQISGIKEKIMGENNQRPVLNVHPQPVKNQQIRSVSQPRTPVQQIFHYNPPRVVFNNSTQAASFQQNQFKPSTNPTPINQHSNQLTYRNYNQAEKPEMRSVSQNKRSQENRQVQYAVPLMINQARVENPMNIIKTVPEGQLQKIVASSESIQRSNKKIYPTPQQIKTNTLIVQKTLPENRPQPVPTPFIASPPEQKHATEIINEVQQNVDHISDVEQREEEQKETSKADRKYEALYEDQEIEQNKNYSQKIQFQRQESNHNDHQNYSPEQQWKNNKEQTIMNSSEVQKSEETKIREITSQVIYLNQNNQNNSQKDPQNNVCYGDLKEQSRHDIYPATQQIHAHQISQNQITQNQNNDYPYSQNQNTSHNYEVRRQSERREWRQGGSRQTREIGEASKISIKSSNDLKGMVSYKDLRDLLRSTRKK